MKNDSIKVLLNQNVSLKSDFSNQSSYPTLHQIKDYHDLAHELRSNNFAIMGEGILSYFASLFRKFEEYQLNRKAVFELDQLSTSMLKDIGITRADVEQLRYGVTTVKAINDRRLKQYEDRLKINKTGKLKLCDYIEKVEPKTYDSLADLAKCG